METIVTPAGNTIAFDRVTGSGAGTVILIGGAFSYRQFPKMVELAQRLADDYGLTVINYDRRGRGDSTDTPGVYDVENEIDDLAALVAEVGGAASLFGWSSGAGLALRAAASGRVPGITKVVAFEPPFVVNHENFVPAADLASTLHTLVKEDRRAETVKFYMTKAMGIPRFFTAVMPFTPMWKNLLATASSTPHCWAVMEPFMRGEALRERDWAGVTVPTLVISGGKSDKLLRTAARAITEVLPDARHVELPKLSHNPNIGMLTPPAGEFLVSA
ncbi:alpha/beta fold hydrolase [Nocardia sp. NPDC003693]